MKTRSKGFTLIELLAVIVILAIIALIATPTILGVIETARKGSAESSAYGYIDAVEKAIALNMLDTTKTAIVDGVYETEDLKNASYSVTLKGSTPEAGSWIQVSNNQITNYSLKFGNYVVNPVNNLAVATKKDDLEPKPEGGSTPQGPVAYYEFGEPTTSSTTDYTTLGKNVFVKLEGEQKSVCIVRNGELSCLKNNNYSEYSSSLPTTGFAGMSCYDYGSSVDCDDGPFDCSVLSDGIVYCYDYSTIASCYVDVSGDVDCRE